MADELNSNKTEREVTQDYLFEVCQRIEELPYVQTSVGAVLKTEEDESRYVVVYNADKKSYGNPAGHLKPEEGLIEGVEREITEETGLTPTQYQITGISQVAIFRYPDKTKLDLVFEGVVGRGVNLGSIINDEDVTWAGFLTADEIRVRNTEYEKQIGSTVLWIATDQPKKTPGQLLNDLVSCFEECNIPSSVLSEK
jgi:ADP-ribose pyrophosphatase YjhB (NUDIX family)